jgi:hypothetical protein
MTMPSRRNALMLLAAAAAALPWRRALAAAGTIGRPAPQGFIANPCVDPAFVRRFPEASMIGDGVANDQPAIQKAIDFAAATGAATVRFGKPAYAVWVPARTSDPAMKNVEDGQPIIVRQSVALIGRAQGRTTLRFRNVDGRSLAAAWQVVKGKVWRGGGIFLKGLLSYDRSGAVPPSILLSDLDLDGGCPMGSFFGYPARPSDGDGWDITNKGLWAEDDRRTGDWTIHRCKVSGFRGEMIYQGGEYHGAITMRDVEFAHTNADILNPCGTNIDIERGYFHHGFSAWEGWGGRKGRIVDCLFENCQHGGGMQGGKAYTQTHERGAFARPTPFAAGVKPWLTLDIRMVDCGNVYIGSWVRGRIDLTDSVLAISSKVFHSVSDIDVDVIARCRKKRLPAALSITGGGPGQVLLRVITVRLKVEPSKTGGYARPVQTQGDTSAARVVLT